MTRGILLLSLAALGVCHASALAACPSGLPNEIVCEDYDTYCTTGGFPGSPDCTLGATKDDTKVQTVWQRTSVDESTSALCGTEFIVDTDPVYLSSLLFGGRHPCLPEDQIGQSSVVNWNDAPPRTPGISFLVQSAFPGYDAVQGMDVAPLMVEFYLSGVNKHEAGLGGGLSRSTAYMELARGNDRANTDYVSTPPCVSYCSPGIGQGPFPIMCANGNPENGLALPAGCPALVDAPVHAAVAIGTMNMLDPDPCHCGSQEHGGINWKLSLYDGRLWWILHTNNPMPSSGSLIVDPVNPGAEMPPPDAAAMSKPGDFQMASGKFGGDGPPNQWVTLTIKTSTFDVGMISREKSSNGYYYLVTNVMNDIPRKYTGPFDQLRGGLGAGCALASNAGWTNNCAAGGRHCLVTHKSNANAVIFDDLVLHGGIGYNPDGACCLDNADCTNGISQTDCETEPPAGLGGVWRGSSTTCETLATPCCPVPFADGDHDGDVDQDDFGAFQLCYTGTGGGVPPGCFCFDHDGDNDIDHVDFTAFSNCYSGANVPWSPGGLCTP